ncbi:MAG: helix-turn-helix transcriptional regulator [Actinomycetota bacterium]
MLLDRLMKDLHVSVGPFAMCEIASGSRLTIGELGWVTIHFVLAGSGHVSMGRARGPEISKYTLALVKRRHILEGSGGDDTPAEGLSIPGGERLIGDPPGNADFVVACGRIQAAYGEGLSLFDGIDDPILEDFSDSKTMRLLFEMILSESGEHTEGSLGMIEALMRQCLVLLLRRLKETNDSRLTFLDGLQDARMSAAIAEVLDDPAYPHTVQSMASAAMMSRSAFSDRFRKCFNDTPMAFVRQVRLRQSAEMLRTTQRSISAVAAATGFSSRSHFSQSFSTAFGVPPGEFRRRVGQDSPVSSPVEMPA